MGGKKGNTNRVDHPVAWLDRFGSTFGGSFSLLFALWPGVGKPTHLDHLT